MTECNDYCIPLFYCIMGIYNPLYWLFIQWLWKEVMLINLQWRFMKHYSVNQQYTRMIWPVIISSGALLSFISAIQSTQSLLFTKHRKMVDTKLSFISAVVRVHHFKHRLVSIFIWSHHCGILISSGPKEKKLYCKSRSIIYSPILKSVAEIIFHSHNHIISNWIWNYKFN